MSHIRCGKKKLQQQLISSLQLFLFGVVVPRTLDHVLNVSHDARLGVNVHVDLSPHMRMLILS